MTRSGKTPEIRRLLGWFERPKSLEPIRTSSGNPAVGRPGSTTGTGERTVAIGIACSLPSAGRGARIPVVPFVSPYGDFAKALIRLRASNRAVGASRQAAMVRALQFLDATTQNSHDRSDPTRLTRRHFHLAMEEVQRQCAAGTAYNIGMRCGRSRSS